MTLRIVLLGAFAFSALGMVAIRAFGAYGDTSYPCLHVEATNSTCEGCTSVACYCDFWQLCNAATIVCRSVPNVTPQSTYKAKCVVVECYYTLACASDPASPCTGWSGNCIPVGEIVYQGSQSACSQTGDPCLGG